MTAAEVDARWMARAVELGRRGDPSPNPHVGALVVREDAVLGEGFHQAAGDRHAEVVALAKAGDAARGATLYVTLEPCAHQGRTPPCVEAVLASGVARVVIGCLDPNPHVAGGGADHLRGAGIEVMTGVHEAECQALIRPWARFIVSGRSWLSLKLAVSLDGRIATKTGASRWITCPESRARVHALRAAHDAVLVGVDTIVADDPRLTVRDAPGRSPIRVVADSKLRIPPTSAVVQTAREVPTCVLTTREAPRAAAQALEALGVSVVVVEAGAEGRCEAASMLAELAAREVVSVMCEGGAELAGSLLASALVDEMHVFVAPVLLGPRGRPGAVDWAGPEAPTEAPRLEPARWELSGTDAYVTGTLHYPRRGPRTHPGT
ncbi:MAG: bifunctional diaminohydroxyphosphoribosylaminopyrimidine deaminase/5-amino-6-(5-phosphoribosylamino)uracil reductase RibD [Polyangiaceae bacterium]|nr:bifunctional diaminohydroxyphosphoribosylaminopyrimidine deaminase/5-amino-6-(5-phosphoribosylamino)uracil reductase RibD [Polyangiaceae bacterium]